MGVVGAFGRWEARIGEHARGRRFIPLVYVVDADDEITAKGFHRSIWSQGAVPLAIFLTPKYIYPSIGFDFSYDIWPPYENRIPVSDLSKSEAVLERLESFQAVKLASHIGLRDLSVHPETRVDRRLLKSLKGLRDYLTTQGLVDAQLINLLIGRFLYLYVLLDRNLIPQSWLERFGGSEAFCTDSNDLTAQGCWALFDAIDGLLNGSIFPIESTDRRHVADEHVRALRNCLKLGHEFASTGQQLSFVDFDLSTIQTETLSAIYEDFIDVEKTSEDSSKREDGAYYTPPFLVDFVVDRVDEIARLSPGIKVLDGTAGSGAFLVAAYRRIVEFVLAGTTMRTLPARKLRKLLTDSIYGIEKTSSACAVSAFGLYLTMLDYADANEVSSYIRGRRGDKLFPPLLGRNLICEDLFVHLTKRESSWREKFHVILGNPPWNKLGLVTNHEDVVLKNYKHGIDGKEAAEAAVLTLMDHLLAPSGVGGFVIPTKSLVGPSSEAFPRTIFSAYSVTGVVNLSHLRYTLFSDARQPASAIFLKKNPPKLTNVFWTYSPLRPQLVTDKNLDIWFLSLDKSKVEYARQHQVPRDNEVLFSHLMLRPIDRHVVRYLRSQNDFNGLASIGDWLSKNGLSFGRGGSPAQTGLSPDKLLGADKFKRNDYRQAPGVYLLFHEAQAKLMDEVLTSYSLSEKDLNGVQNNFRAMFSGGILIVPRSMQGIAYCKKPLAFGSSLNAVYATNPAAKGKLLRDKLFVLGKYLCTDIAKYFFALYGKQWILDQARLEKGDLLRIPFPFAYESNWAKLAKLESEAFERHVRDALKLQGWVNDAVLEYGNFRVGYHDGKVPPGFATRLTKIDTAYGNVMTSVLKQSFPRAKIEIGEVSDTIRVNVFLDTERNAYPEVPDNWPSEDEAFLFDPKSWAGSIVKPNERFRWTAESAYADSAHVLRILTN
ncbi:hypothetical protein CKO20_08540 [Rhodocyclus tenuis]|nr:N-6 DNA methylase [Rhodocyclus tenuis]MBK1680417.1 hypothetical protein [Rhodocyclus tenuis]